MDLEHRGAALPGRYPDRGSVSCAPTPVGARSQALPQRFSPPASLGDDAARQAGQRPDRKPGGLSALSCHLSSRVGGDDPHRSRLFHKNAARMRYPAFRRQKLFVGTGVIEAGCKTLIGTRLKRSGMFWTVRGANAIIALRCCRLRARFEDYWEA